MSFRFRGPKYVAGGQLASAQLSREKLRLSSFANAWRA
jgi:hypothetical protein